MNVAATFGQTMSPAWAYFANLSPVVPPGSNRGTNNVKGCLRRGDGKECLLYSHNGTKALIMGLHKGHEAKRKSVFTASSRAAQAKKQRAEELVEAS